MKWIGLTGSIATGKSTVKKLIEGRGFPVIDADAISHQLTAPQAEGYMQIVSYFGNSILNSDQSLNRALLASMIFNDVEKKNKLESILHPLIQIEVQKLKQIYFQQGNSICFYDVPLLFEKNLKPQFDRVVLVWCDLETQIQRLKIRNQLSDEDAQKRIQSQLLMSVKIKNADHCLDNSHDLKSLEKQVSHLLKVLL